MIISSDTHSTILLTVHFGNTQAKSLTINEWAKLSEKLKKNNLEPSVLLKGKLAEILNDCDIDWLPVDRLIGLLERGSALGFALEKWQRSGLWIISQQDDDYPERLKQNLGTKAPPILFGYGNQKLLEKGGIAVVGSRNADQEDLDLTRVLGYEAAKQGYTIVSGGARGVDEGAILSTLEHEGTSIGVLAKDLLRSALSGKYRKHILSGDLALISPFNPEAGFNVGNAMARNKYIYCLSDAAIVVNTTLDKGGTWTGAIEDLKSKWVPLWVQPKEYENTGNMGLVEKGAKWLPKDLSSLEDLIKGEKAQVPEIDFYELFLTKLVPLIRKNPKFKYEIKNRLGVHENQLGIWLKQGVEAALIKKKQKYELLPANLFNPTIDFKAYSADPNLDFYTLFCHKFDQITIDQPLSKKEIIDQLHLCSPQVDNWLKQGVENGQFEKLYKPVRYKSITKEF